MPENLPGYIFGILVGGIFLLAVIRTLAKRFSPIKTVSAVVVDKHKAESFSKYAGNGKSVKYVVVFSINGKKKGFYVSQFSYGGYRIGEKGTLQYKGDRLIGFR